MICMGCGYSFIAFIDYMLIFTTGASVLKAKRKYKSNN